MSECKIPDLLIREENFITEMKEKVRPYLSSHRMEITLQREEHHPIHCVLYTPHNPEGIILISHGFTETSAKYEELAFYFLRENYAVYIPEHCGHGQTYRLTEHPYKVHVDDDERYVKDLLVTAHTAKAYNPMVPLYLFAHSMGGAIGAAAAAKEPELFDKIILNAPMIRYATGKFPWPAARFLAWLYCLTGKAEDYGPGQHDFTGKERFEHSAAVSKPRFDSYQEFRNSEPLAQMNGATYGWMHAAAKMDTGLIRRGWKKIQCPLLLFQADDDGFVVNELQNRFIQKIQRHTEAELVHLPGTKHEIFNSHDDTMEIYLGRIVQFLNS